MFLIKLIEQYHWSFWIIMGMLLLILEIFTPGFVVSLIGIAAIFTGIVSIFFKNVIFELLLFCIFLILLMIFIRPLFLKYLSGNKKVNSNIDALIGKEVLVYSDIDNLKGSGYIKVGADYWKARSSDGSIIKKDSIVIIEKFEGITAIVSLKK